MSNWMDHPDGDKLVKLSGKIAAYEKQRRRASFALTDAAHARIGMQATAVAALQPNQKDLIIDRTRNTSAIEDDVDYVQFMLDDRPAKGWMWRSPFNDGDEIEAVAQWQGEHYEVYAIARPADKTFASYPHCSRGRAAHLKNVLKWYAGLGLVGVFVLVAILSVYLQGWIAFAKPNVYVISSVVSFFVGIMFYSLARKWLPFVDATEKMFHILGWPDIENIDLVGSSKGRRATGDVYGLGTFYFRY
ncbi:MAG: hypothetical protein JWP38_3137 [Herbaspirillum sp.]|jgi:hypothetical protein|nr:hypothetical protein [Herbaspirillum sp.]